MSFKIHLLWLIALPLLMVACAQPEGPTYTEEDGVTRLSLASSKYKAELSPEDGSTIKVKVQRNTAKGAFSAPVIFTSDNAIFTMPDTTVSFADGESVAYLNINFPGSEQMSVTDAYNMSVSLDSGLLTISGIAKMEITLSRKLTWITVGVGRYYSDFIFQTGYPAEQAWDQPVQHAQEVPSFYRLPSCYKEGYHITFFVNADNTISFNEQEIGLDLGYGMVSIVLPSEYGQPVVPEKVGDVANLSAVFVDPDDPWGIFDDTFTFPAGN
ncbi:MAG: hypothetical protein LBH34_03425 [Prevotellaceae bacterium]|nr:hypothetical protein [Prevotellaceae bacterium]